MGGLGVGTKDLEVPEVLLGVEDTTPVTMVTWPILEQLQRMEYDTVGEDNDLSCHCHLLSDPPFTRFISIHMMLIQSKLGSSLERSCCNKYHIPLRH